MKKINYKNFAKAFFEIGKEFNILNNLINDLEDIEEKLDRNLELWRFLNDRQVRAVAKEEAWRKVFQDSVNDKTYNFIKLLIKNKALNYLGKIIDEIKKEKFKEENILEISAVSSEPIRAETQKRISQVLSEKTGQKIIIKNLIDETLIGGLLIKIGDTIIDGSIKGKINRLKYKINQIT